MGERTARPGEDAGAFSAELLVAAPTARALPSRDVDLALIGAVSTVLDPERCLQSLDAALELIAQALGADSGEMFLLDPNADELLLVCQRGAERDAFTQRCRFTVGVGFPGLAVQTGLPQYTTNLQHEQDFLREGVKAHGFQSFVSVPFGASRRVVGTLNFAWKHDDVDPERVARVVGALGRPTANAVLAAGAMEPRKWARAGDEIHDRFLSASQADEVILIRLGEHLGAGGRSNERLGSPWDTSRTNCSLAGKGHLVLHRDPALMSGNCLSSCGAAEARYCVPLLRNGEVQGVARLSYADQVPFPPTRHAVETLSLAASVSYESRPALLPAIEVEPPPPALELNCFGAFEIFVDGEPLSRAAFSRKKAIELLQLLVLQTGRPLPTRRLARLLWPGVDPDAARNRLHGVVHALRNAIEPKVAEEPAHAYVRSKDDLYTLEASTAVRVDLWEFRRLMETARNASLAGDRSSGVAAALRQAVDIYRGELFAGVPDALWTIDPRSRCREQCVNALLQLAQIHGERGTPDEVIHLVRQAVAVDPLREDVHIRLIRALLADGRRRDALVQYEALCTALDEELDAVPSAEARKLLAEIRAD